jgi:hypothetical protein
MARGKAEGVFGIGDLVDACLERVLPTGTALGLANTLISSTSYLKSWDAVCAFLEAEVRVQLRCMHVGVRAPAPAAVSVSALRPSRWLVAAPSRCPLVCPRSPNVTTVPLLVLERCPCRYWVSAF